MGEKRLEVAIAAGGTAGHINPALALAEELRDRGHHVRFFGQTVKLEGRLVPEAGFELVPVVVWGFDRSRPWTLVSSLYRMRRAQSQISSLFSAEGAPDVAVGFGAYVEMALLNCCHRLRRPVRPPRAELGARTCQQGPRAPRSGGVHLRPRRARGLRARGERSPSVVLTGNPVRRSVVNANRAEGRAAFGVEPGETMLLVFGAPSARPT